MADDEVFVERGPEVVAHPDQADQLELEKERAKLSEPAFVAPDEHDVLTPAVKTPRNPLAPQPFPDADPLVPNVNRPSRSRSEENTPGTHLKRGPQVAEETDAVTGEPAPGERQRNEFGRVESQEELEERQAAAEKAAAKRRRDRKAKAKAADEEHEKRSAAAKKAAKTRAANEAKE